ncbi:DNA-(apurinic or apyrimidinic site) lyase 2-like [Acanthaster planci]|uniref:DNA-(apurinic or apyrimidinic site) endonuclease n=1 Tax=Acanthaster planci TaxID=133434 RepID=A0A8B7XRG1_ACAPL|nr:DNA-(apurinic or apyrimidinic site) lyase 2-like [Acanthaster planci]
MNILTWNINGIRASKVAIKELLDSLDSDIICLQETKVTRDLLDDAIVNVDGYSSYFSFSRKRTGYSGVATYCRNSVTPSRAEEGLTGRLAKGSDDIGCYGNQTSFTNEELQSLDSEGRAIVTQHTIKDTEGGLHELVVINVYCPRADPDNQERMAYKLHFYNLLQLRAEALVKAGRHVVVVGDINASHRRIDNCDPGPDFEEHPGRQWLNSFLHDNTPGKLSSETETSLTLTNDSESSSNKQQHKPSDSSPRIFVDTFRRFHPTRQKAFTCWSTRTGARQTNYGTRIDYIFTNVGLFQRMVTSCDIMPEVEGSDHCPVKASMSCEPVPSTKLPELCSRNMPEFLGKQQKLLSFFQKLSPSKVALARKVEMQESRPRDDSKLGLKRTGSDPGSHRSQKKFKMDPIEPRRGSLMNFFPKKKSQEADSGNKMTDADVVTKPELVKSTSMPPADLNAMIDNNTNGGSPDTCISETSLNLKSKRFSQDSLTDGSNRSKANSASVWKQLLSGPPPAPACKGHNEPCLLRTVKKPGPNLGKKFYVCPRPEGHKNNPEARCNTFIWVTKAK